MLQKNYSAFSIIRLYNSFKFAFNGLWYVLYNEKNMHIHLIACVLCLFLGYILKLSGVEWCIIFLCIALVSVTETINTAIETAINLVSPNYNLLAKQAKDVAAGAVLLASIIACIIGCIIFLPKIGLIINNLLI